MGKSFQFYITSIFRFMRRSSKQATKYMVVKSERKLSVIEKIFRLLLNPRLASCFYPIARSVITTFEGFLELNNIKITWCNIWGLWKVWIGLNIRFRRASSVASKYDKLHVICFKICLLPLEPKNQ